MEKEDLSNEEDAKLTLEDSIEILTTDDKRLKIIGEEISNETGMAILSKLFEGITNVSAIASSLNISIQLVSWHIERLSKVGLIKINRIDLSDKNKEIRHYEPKKLALIIIPSSVTKSPIHLSIFKSALKKIHDKIPVLATFVGSSIVIYLTQKILNLNQISLQMSDPDAVHYFYDTPDFVISITGAIAAATIVWFLKRLKN